MSKVTYEERVVYRVEHPSGDGMFTNPDWKMVREYTEIFGRHCTFNTPSQDNLILSMGGLDWYCAYKSEEEIRKWVTPSELKWLHEQLGCEAYKITVNIYQEGQHQIIFTQGSVTKKECITQSLINQSLSHESSSLQK